MKTVYDEYVSNEDLIADHEGLFGWTELTPAPSFEVQQGDIMAVDWHDADLILCNSTCFTIDMMEQIHERALRCKKGTWMITLSNRLPHTDRLTAKAEETSEQAWVIVLGIKLNMSWGEATVNIHRKRMHPISE